MLTQDSITLIKAISSMKEAERRILILSYDNKDDSKGYDKVCTDIVQTRLYFSCESYMEDLRGDNLAKKSLSGKVIDILCELYKPIILGHAFTRLFYDKKDAMLFSSELDIGSYKSPSDTLSELVFTIECPSYDWPAHCSIYAAMKFNICGLIVSNVDYKQVKEEDIKREEPINCLIPIRDRFSLTEVSKHIKEYVDDLITVNAQYLLCMRAGMHTSEEAIYRYSDRIYNIFMAIYMYALEEDELKEFLSSNTEEQ